MSYWEWQNESDDSDLLTANIEKISDAGENAEHMPRVALVPAALGPSDFCEV